MTVIILAVKAPGVGSERMGHSREDKAESHERIVKAAAEKFRQRGIDGVGVADLMKEAGLSHGGFYRHFDSREELVAEAIECALKDGSRRVAEALKGGKPSALFTLVDAYLSTAHRDSLGTSCAVASLAGDIARSNDRARTAYSRQVEAYVDLLSGLMAKARREPVRAEALTTLCTLVGAVAMSRAVNDDTLSREVLRTAAEALKSRLG